MKTEIITRGLPALLSLTLAINCITHPLTALASTGSQPEASVRDGEAQSSVEGSADDVCGLDRRCRIERLKRQNRARRQIQELGIERAARGLAQQEELEIIPIRRRHPWSLSLRMNRLGFMGGYSLTPGYRIEFTRWEELALDNLTAFSLQFTYVFSEGVWGPYLSLGGTRMSGTRYSFRRVWPEDDNSYGNNEPWDWEGTTSFVIVHAFRLAAGVDLAIGTFSWPRWLKWYGIRFGWVYQPHIYHRVRVEDQEYDQEETRSLGSDLEYYFRFQPELFVGVGF